MRKIDNTTPYLFKRYDECLLTIQRLEVHSRFLGQSRRRLCRCRPSKFLRIRVRPIRPGSGLESAAGLRNGASSTSGQGRFPVSRGRASEKLFASTDFCLAWSGTSGRKGETWMFRVRRSWVLILVQFSSHYIRKIWWLLQNTVFLRSFLPFLVPPLMNNTSLNRGLIELAQSGGTHRHLPEQYGSTCFSGNPRRKLNFQLGALGPTLSVWCPVSATH